jgi:hypothetical protein
MDSSELKAQQSVIAALTETASEEQAKTTPKQFRLTA